MPIAVELRTRCERCNDPLPLNAWNTAVPCWACLHQNPVSPEHWAQLLHGALKEGRWGGDGATENLQVGKRAYELRWSVVPAPTGPIRQRPPEMRAELFPGVIGVASEEIGAPSSTEHVEFKCPQCAANLAIDGRSREITCSYCQARTQLSDDAWRRIHPIHAQRAWVLVFEGDGIEVGAMPVRGRPTSPDFLVHDAMVGPEGHIYAAAQFVAGGSFKSSVVCLDGDLTIRWRTDVKSKTDLLWRVAVVGDEVWWVDPGKHVVRRFARVDGKSIGEVGGEEPEGATGPYLDIKGSCDLIGCPDGTVLALVAMRFVRFDAKGQAIPTWPQAKGVMGWLRGREKLRPLYEGPLEDSMFKDQPSSVRTLYGQPAGVPEHLGRDRPTSTPTVSTHGVTAPDGSLWLYDGAKVFRYDRDGKCRWTAIVSQVQSLGVRPGVDGEMHCYVVAVEGRKSVLHRIDPQGNVTRLTDEDVGGVQALAVTAEGRIFVFGQASGEVRVFDRQGRRLRASGAAVEADRRSAEHAADEDADEDE